MKRIAAFLFAVLVMPLSASCTRDPTSESILEKEAGELIELALVPPAMESPFYAGVIEAASPKAEELGYKLTILSPERHEDLAGQSKIVEDLVQRGVGGIALCSLDIETIVPAVRQANEAGIPVVVFNSLTELPGCDVYAYTGYDQRQAGVNIADWVNKVMNGQARVSIIDGLPGVHTTERAAGFIDRVASVYPGIQIVSQRAADWVYERSVIVATEMLEEDNSIQVIYALNDEMALGAAQAAKQLGRSDVLIVGIDGNPNALNAIKNGELSASLYVNPGLIGSLAIEMLDAALQGKPSQENKQVVIETIIVDKTTVDQYLNQNTPRSP